jgi:hypothetical protein
MSLSELSYLRKKLDSNEEKIESLKATLDEKQPLIKPVVDNPETQKILDKAAKGDTSALPTVRELLKNPQNLTAWGAVGDFATNSLIRQAAGTDLLVRDAMKEKCAEYRKRLLDDCGPEPTFAEELAAIRATQNWLTVNILEILASRQQASSTAAAVIDKRITLAEKRLHASLKSLAILRRLRWPTVVAVVNAATPQIAQQQSTPAQMTLQPIES